MYTVSTRPQSCAHSVHASTKEHLCSYTKLSSSKVTVCKQLILPCLHIIQYNYQIQHCTRTHAALSRCSSLDAPSNGEVVTTSADVSTELVVGSTAHYSCNSGYVLAGRGHLVCTFNREGVDWNGNSPTCMKVYS